MNRHLGQIRWGPQRPLCIMLACATALLSILLVGCQTTEIPDKTEADAWATAAIRIRGNTPGQITEVATEIFEASGYTRSNRASGALVFEKPGSKTSNVAYGNWMGGEPIWVRVKLSILPAGEAEHTLRCRAYRVRDRGSATEEELKIGKLSASPYRKLLNEIAARFQRPTGAAHTPPTQAQP